MMDGSGACRSPRLSAVVTSHSTGLGLSNNSVKQGPYLGGCVPYVSTVTPCGSNCEKEWPPPLTEQVFWFSLVGVSLPGSFGVLRGRRILGREGQGWLQSVWTKPLSEREPVLPSSSQWRRKCSSTVSLQKLSSHSTGKIRTKQLEGSEIFGMNGKANQTTSQANHQITSLKQKP